LAYNFCVYLCCFGAVMSGHILKMPHIKSGLNTMCCKWT